MWFLDFFGNYVNFPPSCADCLEIWEPQIPWNLWASPGLYWDCFYFQTLNRYDNFLILFPVYVSQMV
jgi:hypothetical protein